MGNLFFAGKDGLSADIPRICADQAGYLPKSCKTAVLTFPAELFSIIDENGEKHFEGAVTHFGHD